MYFGTSPFYHRIKGLARKKRQSEILRLKKVKNGQREGGYQTGPIPLEGGRQHIVQRFLRGKFGGRVGRMPDLPL
jgi:hypothetical protein